MDDVENYMLLTYTVSALTMEMGVVLQPIDLYVSIEYA